MPTISTVIQRINRQVRLKQMDGAARCRMSRTANPLFPRRAPKVTSNTRPDGFLLRWPRTSQSWFSAWRTFLPRREALLVAICWD